jgi:hypothetical protein
VTSLTDTRLAWTGSLAIPGLFRGEHEFIIEEQGPNKTIFYQNEKMSGIIIPFFDFKPEAAGFVLMNEALKKRAEKSVLERPRAESARDNGGGQDVAGVADIASS